MGVSDNRIINEWFKKSAIKAENVMRGKAEKVGDIFGKSEQCEEFVHKYDKP